MFLVGHWPGAPLSCGSTCLSLASALEVVYNVEFAAVSMLARAHLCSLLLAHLSRAHLIRSGSSRRSVFESTQSQVISILLT